jgi:hypothetical protein
MSYPLKRLLGIIALPIIANRALAESELDLTELPISGVVIEKNFSGQPYWDGTLETYIMQLPDFEQGLVFMQSKVPHIKGTKNQGLLSRTGNRVTGKVFYPDRWGTLVLRQGSGAAGEIVSQWLSPDQANMDGKPFQWLGLHYQTLGWNSGILPGDLNDLGAYNKNMCTITPAPGDRIMPKDTFED